MSTIVIKTIQKFIDRYGLPKEIGTTGWISESQYYDYKNKYIGTATEESKGWIFVNHFNHENQYYNYNDVKSIFAIACAMIENKSNSMELLVEMEDKEFYVDLINEDYDGKGWNWEPEPVDTEYVARSNKLIAEDEEFDIHTFLDEHCEISEIETEYSLPYHTAFIKWSDEKYIELGTKRNKIILKQTVNEQKPMNSVMITLGDEKSLEEITNWLKSNVISKYSITFKPVPYSTIIVNFDNEEEATMFSLRWV